MPGSGKSTVGVLLAKRLRRGFVDTDLVLQERDGRALQEILDREGPQGFIAREEAILLGYAPQGEVVATGGSVVYSEALMRHFSAHGLVVFLDVPAAVLLPRLSNLDTRGVVRRGGQTVAELWDERDPLYRQWADVSIDNSLEDHESVVEAIASLPQLRD
jgi:shikimate kinase